MKYNAPYGVSDPNAGYINGNPAQGIQGSIPPAESIEYPQREIVNLITGNKFTPTNTDLMQVLEATRSQAANYLLDTGSVNTLSVTTNPPLAQYTPGLPLRVRVYAANTGDSTIDAGCGRVSVRRPDGSALQPHDLNAGGIAELVYDGTYFQMVNHLGGQAAGDVINNFLNIPYTVDVSTTPNVITANFSPAITSLAAGTIFMVKIANTNTADTVINVNAIMGQSVRAGGAQGRLMPGDVQSGDVKIFRYDGTIFYIEPDVLLPNTVTINVPSAQFPDMPTVINALARKSISPSAVVTIQLASGKYPGISFNHKDGACIIVRGTMIGAAPGANEFAWNGPSAAQRSADANYNLSMLRTRYGTELQVSSSSTPQWGFRNLGPGSPQLMDVLITGDKSSGTSGIMCDVSYPVQTAMQTQNVAVWGCNWGVYCGGMYRGVSCSFTWCGQGVAAQVGGEIGLVQSFCFGNDYAGVYCTIGATSNVQPTSYICANGVAGIDAAWNSTINFQGSYSIRSGQVDSSAAMASTIAVYGSSVGSFSPPLNTFGNYGSIIGG